MLAWRHLQAQFPVVQSGMIDDVLRKKSLGFQSNKLGVADDEKDL